MQRKPLSSSTSKVLLPSSPQAMAIFHFVQFFLMLLLLATTAQASARPRASGRIVAVERQSSETCMNNGMSCRCSKSTSPGASLCKRHVGNSQCSVDLCDEPFQCDCSGDFMCERTSSTAYWECDEAGSAVFRETDTCKCSQQNRTKASYGLRVTQSLEQYIRGAGDPLSGCDMPADFWA